jgi:hypothetical protein
MRKTIGTMHVGDVLYTVPWAMTADGQGGMRLHASYIADREPHGTVTMRVALEAGGYHVWPVPGYQYAVSGGRGTTT